MTQEYEPIKLNESTPAPKEDGIYLLTITFKPETKTLPLFKEGDEYLGADSTYSWGELVKELSTADEATIQSLADHDARIRAEATETTADTYIIHTPRILPLGVPVDRATLQSVWDAFVTPSQDSGEVQSIEMRALMASLRELYRALPEREGTQ
ncbi:hypothetical protein [Bifidobacterium psychraerophilum]|uniref:hypothetical protein n=1 Tax=Bifidobacterium psychraerophilum TaxID=218140 RepID=UPI0039EB3E87